MNWLTNLFSPTSKTTARRGQAISSTDDAFSLGSHPDAFNPETIQALDPMSPAYTYPPQSPTSAYGYIPTSTGSRSRPTSLLPLHNTPYTDAMTPLPPYPPLAHTWNRLKIWLAREYPELGDTLNYGILPQDLAQVEINLGFPLPQAVRESYLAVDGQEAESSAGCSEGLFFGLSLLPLEDVIEEWRFWREVDDDPTTGANPRLKEVMQSVPEGWVRKEYSSRGWIPLVVDKAGNYIGVDINPGEGGQAGQVIVFGRDFDTKVVLWRGEGSAGWARWLSAFVDELEAGEGFEIGGRDGESDGSEDGLGYENYFYDGNGRGHGDGGGEGGTGGMRFTGEYRGWNPLEVWADRSIKKWIEAGVFTGNWSHQGKGKNPEISANPGLGVLAAESSAEVPIPIVSAELEVDDEDSTAMAPLVRSNDRVTHANIPAISITKPPAPLPVGLPTAADVAPLPSPPDSNRSSLENNLEAGRNPPMRQATSPTIVAPHAPSQSVDHPTVAMTPPEDASSPKIPAPAPTVDGIDVFADSAPSEIVSVAPLSPSTVKLNGDKATPAVSEETSEVKVEDEKEATPEPEPEVEAEPSSSIRLVGGGGSSGAAGDEEKSEEKADEKAEEEPVDKAASEAAEVSSITSVGSKTSRKQKRRSSLASGLKKLGSMSNISVKSKRKSDSVSSTGTKESA